MKNKEKKMNIEKNNKFEKFSSFFEKKTENKIEDCNSFDEFNKAIKHLKTLTNKINKEFNGNKSDLDDYIEKRIFGRDV